MKSEILMKLIEMLINSDTNSEQNINTTLKVSEIQEQYPIGKKIILRGYNAWVLFGTLVSVVNWVYRMKDTRRLYYWKAKSGITLEDVANYWIADGSKITSVVSLCDITDHQVSMLIPCSKEAIKSIESAINYQP